MSSHRIWIVLLVNLALVVGCKRRDPTPHISDLIYQDIVKELRTFEQIEEDALKKIETAEKELEKSAPRSIERKNAQSDLQKHQDRLVKIQQQVEFLKIREKRRKIESTEKYNAIFDKNGEWPDKKEYEAYKVNKDLNQASRNWNDRVPQPKNAASFDMEPKDAKTSGH